jgi:type II secretory pathway component PulK
MKTRPGVALMLVLWVIVILGTISSGVILSTRSTSSLAANYRARVVGRYAAESGVNAALAALEDSLRVLGANAALRRDYLNRLDRALPWSGEVPLGEARFAVALVDPGARLDVNAADAGALTALLSRFTNGAEAERVAAAIRAYIAGPATGGEPDLLAVRPLSSLDELAGVPGVPASLVERVAEFLTVDGDGTINRVTASDTVMAAAAGELRDEPSRVVVVSRGWREGHPLTHEIQAVYAIVGADLILVRWRERGL